MKSFEAILNNSIEFDDIMGHPQRVCKGERIIVSVSTTLMLSIALDGKKRIEPVGLLVGTFKNHSFHVTRDEFIVIN